MAETIDEQEIFDPELDEPAEHDIDHLNEVHRDQIAKAEKANENWDKELAKKEPDENALKSLKMLYHDAARAVETAQDNIIAWFAQDTAAWKAQEEQAKRLSELERELPSRTREDRLNRMRHWARNLDTPTILENLKHLGQSLNDIAKSDAIEVTSGSSRRVARAPENPHSERTGAKEIRRRSSGPRIAQRGGCYGSLLADRIELSWVSPEPRPRDHAPGDAL